MSILDHRLTQTMTYWPPLGAGFGPGVRFAPSTPAGGVRWTLQKENRFSREGTRGGVPTSSALLRSAIAVGGCAAVGSFATVAPGTVPGVHEIIEYRETELLTGAGIIRRATLRPLIGQLRQTVSIFPVTRVTSGRSYVATRGAAIYTGAASVDILTGPDAGGRKAAYGAASVFEYDAVVTLPYTVALAASNRYEVDWAGPFGPVTLDGQGPLYNSEQSPFWQSLACILRRADVGG